MRSSSDKAVRRFDAIAELISTPASHILNGFPTPLADRLFGAVIAGASDAELRTLCGSAVAETKYGKRQCRDEHFGDLRQFVYYANVEVGALGRQAEAFATKQKQLRELLESQ